MANLNLVGDDIAAARAILEGIRRQLGLMLNPLRASPNSPAGLQGYLGLSGTRSRGVLPAALREWIAETTGRDACLSAYATVGAGLRAAAIEAARTGEAETAKKQAALSLAQAVLAEHGRSAEGELVAARAAGWDAADHVEIVPHKN